MIAWLIRVERILGCNYDPEGKSHGIPFSDRALDSDNSRNESDTRRAHRKRGVPRWLLFGVREEVGGVKIDPTRRLEDLAK